MQWTSNKIGKNGNNKIQESLTKSDIGGGGLEDLSDVRKLKKNKYINSLNIANSSIKFQ